jgi:hypothetical protein
MPYVTLSALLFEGGISFICGYFYIYSNIKLDV